MFRAPKQLWSLLSTGDGEGDTRSPKKELEVGHTFYDELIRAMHNARNEFVGIEHLTDHQIEAIRTALEQSVGADDEQHRYRTSLRQLLKRR